MAIKRVTIELDDSPDRSNLTKVHEGARVEELGEFKSRELTGLPTERDAEKTESPEVVKAPPRAPGRTASDLFAEFVNQPRAIGTLLTFAPFPFFASSIESLNDLIYPIVVGALLNAVWFGVPWMVGVWNKIRRP